MIARKLRQDSRILPLARRNLRKWTKLDGSNVRPVFKEWNSILTRLNAVEIAKFLCSDTPMARRLRQSSPFAGVLTKAEREAIRTSHEKKGA